MSRFHADLPVKMLQIRNSPLTQALAGEKPDFDFGLIQPASVGKCVVDGEPVPDLTADFFAEQVSHPLTAVDVEIVHNGMDCGGGRILCGEVECHLRKLYA